MSRNARRFSRRKNKQPNDKPIRSSRKPTIELRALTPTQAVYIEALRKDPIVLVTGCAGTGKTFMAATQAAKMYSERNVNTIVITRPNVSVGAKGIGYFPGSLEEKMAPWVAPIIDVLNTHLGRASVEIMIKHGDIKIEPFETLRGKSFEDAFIILDEAQNCTYEELKLFLTRLGDNCKAVINGDVAQTDLAERSGLRKVIGIVKHQMLPFPVIEFSERDIVRSDVCATWIRAFSKYEKNRS